MVDGDIPTTLTLETISGTPVVTNGMRIGTDSTDNLIDDGTNGAASATTYIGNESILMSGDIGVSVQAKDKSYSHVGSSRNTTDADNIMGISSDDGAITITLDTDHVVAGKTFIIKDQDGNAASNNITIDTEASETIDGAADYTISTNYTSISIYSDGTNWFIH